MECIRWLFSPNAINLQLVLAARSSSSAALLCYQLFVLSPVLTQALVVSCTGKLSWARTNLAKKCVCDSKREEARARARLRGGRQSCGSWQHRQPAALSARVQPWRAEIGGSLVFSLTPLSFPIEIFTANSHIILVLFVVFKKITMLGGLLSI